jgi:hypothetical protein
VFLISSQWLKRVNNTPGRTTNAQADPAETVSGFRRSWACALSMALPHSPNRTSAFFKTDSRLPNGGQAGTAHVNCDAISLAIRPVHPV